MGKGLPKRSEDYSLWYNELVKRADLAENSAVRGCMVIKPYGYSIWEKMRNKEIPFEDIFDLFAIRVIIDSQCRSCWKGNRSSACHQVAGGVQV